VPVLYYPQKGCATTYESRDLFKFWEMSNYVSLTVQDRDVVDEFFIEFGAGPDRFF